MFAIVTRHGAMSWESVADPVPGPHEVVIEVAAAGVNRADLLQRAGFYPPPPGASDILGLECAGSIAALGAQVRHWAVGDQVCALLPGGGYAQRVAVDAGLVLPVPATVPLVDAAALPEAVLTAWSNLAPVLAGRAANTVGAQEAELLQRDQAPASGTGEAGVTSHHTLPAVSGRDDGPTVLITGGSGGVGSMAVQLARHLGARVIATAGTRQRAERLRQLGAWAAVDYHENLIAHIAHLTEGRGVDVILDVMGASELEVNLALLAPDGHLVIIGMQGGTHAQVDLGLLLPRRLTVSGSTLRARPLEQRRALVDQVRQYVWPCLESGEIVPVVDRTLPMPDAVAAHTLLEQGGQVFGKVVLTT